MWLGVGPTGSMRGNWHTPAPTRRLSRDVVRTRKGTNALSDVAKASFFFFVKSRREKINGERGGAYRPTFPSPGERAELFRSTKVIEHCRLLTRILTTFQHLFDDS